MPARRFACRGLRWPLRQITSSSSFRPSPVLSCLMRSGGTLCAYSRADRTSMSLAPRLLRVSASLTAMVGTDAGPAAPPAPFRLNGHIVVPGLLDDAVVEHFERAAGENRVQRPVDALHLIAAVELIVGLERLPLRLEDEVDVAERRESALGDVHFVCETQWESLETHDEFYGGDQVQRVYGTLHSILTSGPFEVLYDSVVEQPRHHNVAI